jgi:hypothetical protein
LLQKAVNSTVEPLGRVVDMSTNDRGQALQYLPYYAVCALLPAELVPALNGLSAVVVILSKVVQHVLSRNFKYIADFETWRAGDDENDALQLT